MQSFTYRHACSRVLHEAGAIDRAGDEVAALGCKRLMVTVGRRTRQTRLFARVLAALGDRVQVIFDEVVTHSSTASVAHGAELARQSGIDCLVSVGGGSTSDTAKGIAIVLAEGGKVEDHASTFTAPDRYVQKELKRPKLPIVAIPTTASGAEATPGLGIRSDNGTKLLYWDWQLPARLIILDPEANVEVPAMLMATTAMNGLAHCIEGLCSSVRNPLSSAHASHAIRIFARALPAMMETPHAIEHRSDVLLAAHVAGVVIANARTGIAHAVCHCLGALGGIDHGTAHSIILPHAMVYNMEIAATGLAEAAHALGGQLHSPNAEAAARSSVDLVRSLQRRTGVPTQLRQTSIPRSLLPAIAEHTLRDRSLYFNPRRTSSPEPILELLEAAW